MIVSKEKIIGRNRRGATYVAVSALGDDLDNRDARALPGQQCDGPTGNGSRRRAYNIFLRDSGLVDAVIDFDAVTRDPQTAGLFATMKPGSSIGGPGDGLHPNRIGYQAMSQCIEMMDLLPPRQA